MRELRMEKTFLSIATQAKKCYGVDQELVQCRTEINWYNERNN